MSPLHVIYRVDDDGAGEEWSAYSFPHSIYAGGSSLAETRDEFMRAAKFALGGLDHVTVIEHLEEQLIPGAYIRLALDANHRTGRDRRDHEAFARRTRSA